jgi:trigger factor
MKINIVIALLICVLLVLPFAGCAKNDDTPKETQTGTAASTDNDTDTDTADSKTGFDYSDGIGDDGYLENVTALDLVTLPDYKSIDIPAADHEVTEDEINGQLDSLLSNYTQKKQITDRAVENGDKVNIDYVGSVDGVEFEGGNTQGRGTEVTAGGSGYIDDFLTQIIGHMPGETIDVVVTFPDPYSSNTDLSGKEALFVTTINYIVESVVPELTDDFVKENLTETYKWESAAEVEEYITSIVRKNKLHSFINTYLEEHSEISSVPDSMIEYQKGAMLSYYTNQASQYGMSLDDYISAAFGYDSEDAFVESQKSSLEDASKSLLLIQAVAEKEKLSVTESDVDSFIKTTYLTVTDDMLSQIKEYYGLGYWAQAALADSVYELIISNANLK